MIPIWSSYLAKVLFWRLKKEKLYSDPFRYDLKQNPDPYNDNESTVQIHLHRLYKLKIAYLHSNVWTLLWFPWKHYRIIISLEALPQNYFLESITAKLLPWKHYCTHISLKALPHNYFLGSITAKLFPLKHYRTIISLDELTQNYFLGSFTAQLFPWKH